MYITESPHAALLERSSTLPCYPVDSIAQFSRHLSTMRSLLLFFFGAASALIPRQTTASTTTNALSCTPTYDSATEGIASAYCACGNGFTQPLAPSTASGSYDPCPPTQMPVATATTTQQQWAFTTTQTGGITIECGSASYMGVDGTTFPLVSFPGTASTFPYLHPMAVPWQDADHRAQQEAKCQDRHRQCYHYLRRYSQRHSAFHGHY